MVYDVLDFLTFVQTDTSETVEAFDASVDDIEDSAFTYSNVLDLGAATPNYDGQSVYIRPRADENGELIADSDDATVLLIANLVDGATTSPATERAVVTQVVSTEELEIPLPQGVRRYIKVGLKSDGGAGTADIDAGAVAVRIGKSSRKE